MSVSDIVVLHQNGQDAAHYVDSIGYRDAPEFLKEPQKALAPDDLTTGERIETPRGSFHVAAELEQRAKAGEAISVTDLAKKYGLFQRLFVHAVPLVYALSLARIWGRSITINARPQTA